MKRVFTFLLMIITLILTGQQNGSLREQMAKIRQSTNWEDPVAAKKANEQIRELSKKMLLGGKPAAPAGISEEQKEEMAEDKMQLIDQMMKSVREGEQADVLLGEPIRKKIVEEYREDENPTDINPQFLQEIKILVLDLSSPGVQSKINRMKSYSGIETLVITGGDTGAPVNLITILSNAANYPLKQLYIINFRDFVKTLPAQIGQFKNLSTLSLYNNSLKTLLVSLKGMTKIDSLFVDHNPIAAIEPVVSSLRSLKKLGVVKTSVGEAELQKIHQLLPNCQIIRQ